MEYFPQLLLVLLLIIAGGFFTAAEYAIITVRKTRIDALVKNKHSLAKRVQDVMNKKTEYISTTQIGSTIIGIFIGWFGEPVVSRGIGYIFGLIGIPRNFFLVHLVSVLLAFTLLTFLSILLSELIPKHIALQKSERIIFATVLPVIFFSRIFRPFIKILNRVELFLLAKLNIRPEQQEHVSISKEELDILLNEIKKTGTISREEKEIVGNVFLMNEKTVRQLVKPRSEIIALDGNRTIADVRQTLNGRYSRFPVYKKNIDNIIGFIHIKDIYRAPPELLSKKLSGSGLIRKNISVPEGKKINEVFLDMRRHHVHMAIVYNEFGTFIGMVTLEDIIESVKGDIQDEFDISYSYLKRGADGKYEADGNTPYDVIRKKFHIDGENSDHITVGGYVFSRLGREPRVSDRVMIGNLELTVLSVDGKRITKLLISRQSNTDKNSSKK